MVTWKRDAASGLVVLVPLIVTFLVVAWLYGHLADVPLLKEVIEKEMFGGNAALAEFTRVVLTLLIFGALVLSIGYLMRTALGGLIEARVDDLINRLPGLRVVYNASKMAVETALSGASELQTPVKIEPWEGMRMTAFKTGKSTADGREIVFLPTAPNITTGFVIEVEPEDLTETDESVEDALTRILSAGFGETDGEVSMGSFVEGDDDDTPDRNGAGPQTDRP